MLAVDTNVLVFAEITSSEHHARTKRLLTELAEGASPWAIPWPCVYEFLRVVTHPRVYDPPVPSDRALEDITAIVSSPSLVLLAETDRHALVMQRVIREARARGNLMHDAHIVALCLEHGVRELVTGDRDFRRFSGLKITDPFAT